MFVYDTVVLRPSQRPIDLNLVWVNSECMRQHSFVEGNFYHIYTNSIGNMSLFPAIRDYQRFLLTMFSANGEVSIPRLDRLSGLNLVWDIRDGKIDTGEPLVKIVNFCLMKTHFHCTLGENRNGNISRFMHKILVSFAKYTNKKHERRGHVFESNFHSRPLDTNEYFLRTSCYIHLNPKDIKEWRSKEKQYPWSSYQDYVGKNRWGKLIHPETVLAQFKGGSDYERFVEEARPEIFEGDYIHLN